MDGRIHIVTMEAMQSGLSNRDQDPQDGDEGADAGFEAALQEWRKDRATRQDPVPVLRLASATARADEPPLFSAATADGGPEPGGPSGGPPAVVETRARTTRSAASLPAVADAPRRPRTFVLRAPAGAAVPPVPEAAASAAGPVPAARPRDATAEPVIPAAAAPQEATAGPSRRRRRDDRAPVLISHQVLPTPPRPVPAASPAEAHAAVTQALAQLDADLQAWRAARTALDEIDRLVASRRSSASGGD